jgi:hypothetical protein
MFNNRIVIAQAKLLKDIFLGKNKDYAAYAEIISTYDGPFKALASWLMARDFDKPQTDDIIGHLIPYIKKGRLKTDEIIVSPSAVKIKNSEPFAELLPFVDFIHGRFPTALPTKKVENLTTERTPVISGQGIQIYEVNNPNDSRELAGDTPWCIAYPGQNNMWTSYRSGGASSFFIVFDENPPSPELRKVAVDFNVNGVELTDINNTTGRILTNGMDWDEYSKYLEGKGIDIQAKRTNFETGEEENILKNKPLTDEENFFLQYYNRFKNNSNLTVEQVQKWARGIIEFEPKKETGSRYNEPLELFLEKYKDPKTQEASLRVIHRRPGFRITYGALTNLPIKREQIVYLKYKNSGASYALENTAQSFQDLFDGKPGDLNKLEFGEFGQTEPLSELNLKIDDAKNYLTKFVGLGYVLPDDVFDYVLDLPDGRDLLIQYVDTGITIPEEQVEKIKAVPALFKTYARKQLIALSRNAIYDARILNHLDPNDEKIRNFVLEQLIPKDAKNVVKDDQFKILTGIQNIPDKWLAIPQIGLLKGIESANDPLSEKVAIAIGIRSYFGNNPTVENALIYLHDTDAINTFKGEAIAKKYPADIFEPFYDTKTYEERFNNIRGYNDENGQPLYKNPRLNKYRGFYEGEPSILGTYNVPTTDEEKLLSYERVAISQLCGVIAADDRYRNDPDYYMYLLNNYENITNTVLRNINYFRTETTYYDEDDNEIDIDDVDTNEVEVRENTVEIFDRDRQKRLFESRLSIIPAKILQEPQILTELSSKISPKTLIRSTMRSSKGNKILDEYLADNYVNSFSDLDATGTYIFEQDNPIIRKITQNGFDVDSFLKIFWYRCLNLIRKLASWNPKLVDSISDDDFIKLLEKQNSYSNEDLSYLVAKRPNLLIEFMKTHINRFSWEQRQYINTLLASQTKQVEPKPEQIPEPAPEITPETPEEKKDEEEPTIASVNLMVKIAQKLDLKKKYRLADKLTYILRKKI